MGLQNNKSKKKSLIKRNLSRSKNIYLNLLIKIYRFLATRTKTNFNFVILKRLFASRSNKAPVSLSRLIKYSDKKKMIVVVGKVLNDERNVWIPRLSVCALKFSSSARQRILEKGGEVFSFDQLARNNPTGKGVILLRGKTKKKNYKVRKNLAAKKVL